MVEVRDSLVLEEDIVLYVLHYYKWSKENLYENYYSTDFFQKKNEELKNALSKPPDKVIEVCSICEEKAILIKNPLCQHRYCGECWKGYLR